MLKIQHQLKVRNGNVNVGVPADVGHAMDRANRPGNLILYIIPILIFACNRVSVSKAIDPLLQYRGDDSVRITKFPIIV